MLLLLPLPVHTVSVSQMQQRSAVFGLSDVDLT